MTTELRKIASEGSGYWLQYVRLNGYAFRPNREGLAKLSRNLDINTKHLSRCITAYLEA
jgi:hypothetical protein